MDNITKCLRYFIFEMIKLLLFFLDHLYVTEIIVLFLFWYEINIPVTTYSTFLTFIFYV